MREKHQAAAIQAYLERAKTTPEIPLYESPGPEVFLGRLAPADRQAVEGIVDIVSELADRFDSERVTYPGFFAVYGIGGNVTKEGERPDVDLLIVTSARWDGGYEGEEAQDWYLKPGGFEERMRLEEENRRFNNDTVLGTLKDRLKDKYSIEIIDKLPSNYTAGDGTKGLLRLTPLNEPRNPINIAKGLLRITSADSERKPIDIAYLRYSPFVEVDGKYRDYKLEDFEKSVDIDESGNPLPKVTLFKAEDRGQEILMRW